MKKTLILSLFIIFVNSNIYSQDDYKNKRFFNLSKISFHQVGNISEGIFTPNVGNSTNNYEKGNSFTYSVYSINGWFLFHWLSTGIGIGYEYQNTIKFSLMPVYLDLRTYLSKNRNSFYLYLDVGTVYGLNKEIERGFLLDAGVGYKFFINDNLCLTIGIGLNGRTVDINDFAEPYPIHNFTINSKSINIGILF